MCCFFFSSRRRHTRFDCDWSSDVCSSDLELRKKLERTAFVNSGGWFLYIVPIAIVIACFKRICSPLFSILYRSEEHTSELQSQSNLVCRLLLEKKKKKKKDTVMNENLITR